MATDSVNLTQAHGTAAAHGGDLSRLMQEGQDTLVQTTLQNLRESINTLKELPLLHKLRVFHVDTSERYIRLLEENPTQERLEDATRHVLSMETVFELNKIATVDMVTGLPNRKEITKQIEIAISDLQREELGSAAIAFIDLNKFKPINDELGHDEGDSALALVGRKISEVLRKNDIVARLGGDEFVILFHHREKDHDFTQDIKRVQDLLQRGISYTAKTGKNKGRIYPIGGAIGIEVLTAQSTPDNALKNADAEMYRIKHTPDKAPEPPAPEGLG